MFVEINFGSSENGPLENLFSILPPVALIGLAITIWIFNSQRKSEVIRILAQQRIDALKNIYDQVNFINQSAMSIDLNISLAGQNPSSYRKWLNANADKMDAFPPLLFHQLNMLQLAHASQVLLGKDDFERFEKWGQNVLCKWVEETNSDELYATLDNVLQMNDIYPKDFILYLREKQFDKRWLVIADKK